MEIRLHGRGGQGGVTCAKILAALYARLGKSVQAFGDYASERSGAPVRAYTRVSDEPVTSRNKVYEPDHLVVLDQHLLGEEIVTGLAPGGILLVNTPDAQEELAARFPAFRVATVDATAIARRRGIGTRSVVIVNTTIAGAFVKVHGLPLDILGRVYRELGFWSNYEAAVEAFENVVIGEAQVVPAAATATASAATKPASVPVEAITDHVVSLPTGLQTGSWRTQQPRYQEHLAPCNAWCPAGNDVVGFIQALAQTGPEAAAEVLAASNPLAGVCGHVCPAPCMEACNRGEYDGSVNIRGLERWISDHETVGRSNGVHPPETRRRIAIVGGGPAGLAAAYTVARAGHQATIYDKEQQLGGLLRTGIPSYRLPRTVLDRELESILGLGVETRTGVSLDAAAVRALGEEYDAVILATGLQSLRGLQVPGADLEGIEQGIDFLHSLNLEGPGARLQGPVVVLGGGNTAMDCARSALRCGAESVSVAYRRTRAEMPAIAEEIELAAEEGIWLHYQVQPVAFLGDQKVSAIDVAEVEMGEPDDTGRRRPITTDRRRTISCSHVLLALGQSADFGLLGPGWKLEGGQIHENGKALPFFAAGDLATGEGTVTHAVGHGRRAAGLALRHLGAEVEVFERPDREHAVAATDIRFDHFAAAAPIREKLDPAAERIRSFEAVSHGLESALEAHRCFSCGHCTHCDTCIVYCPEGSIHRKSADYDVDYSYCKGCGICVAECPRAGMEMADL